MLIRDETPADESAITAVTLAAFRDLAISQHNEQVIITALRAAGALAISLVAEVDGRVVGHIAFSPVTISAPASPGTPGIPSTPASPGPGTPVTHDWYGLGPVSVLPEFQRRGIGGALIRAGLERLQSPPLRAQGCCLVGHPDYYPRFGFQNPPGLIFPGIPATVFFALSFAGPVPHGQVAFHPAFAAAGGGH